MNERRHIPYLSFHKTIIREICRPQQDDLVIIAKGLGLRRVSLEAEFGASVVALWQCVC